MARKILTVVGARPQFIKAAAVSRAFRAFPGMIEVMVHSGQHFDDNMSEVFFRELEIPQPAHNLKVHGGSHGQMTGRMLEGIERVILDEKPDWVLVYGDTNSTLAGALAAAKLYVPVAHVEAGLRSFDRRMPEEVNRVLTDHLSSLLFCPTRSAIENLVAEGITDGIYKVGDVMFDATLHAVARAKARSTILESLGLTAGSYVLATVHRAENTDTAENLRAVFEFLRSEAGGLLIVLPLHPRTRQAALRFGLSLEGLVVVEPVGYLDMTRLLDGCKMVLTDSGGLQKEAYFHRKPCVTLRDQTEWVETVEAGWNRLWKAPTYNCRREIDEYGDGLAAREMLSRLQAA